MRTMRVGRGVGMLLAALAAFGVGTVCAVPRTWTGAVNNDWSAAGNWDPSDSAPQADDAVTITNGAPVVSGSTHALESLTITNATLTATNWTTAITAATVTLRAGGVITCSGPFGNAPAMTNRVHILCTDLTIDAGGEVNVSGKGYAGGTGSGAGMGPGGSSGTTYDPGGAGHGGMGGTGAATSGGAAYGSATVPQTPGSGGGGASASGSGTHGGGVIRIIASGLVTIRGAIRANGLDSSARGGKGSGGSIYITANQVAGTNGFLQAFGGSQTGSTQNSGTGAGGRIAVLTAVPAQAGTVLTISTATGAEPGKEYRRGEFGTIRLSDGSLLASDLSNVEGSVEGSFSISGTSLFLSNRWLGFADAVDATITGNVRVDGDKSRLYLGGNGYATISGIYCRYGTGVATTLRIDGDMSLTNSALLYVYSASTNGQPVTYGARLDVGGTLSLATGTRVYAWSHPTSAGSPELRACDLVVATNAVIDANAKGFFKAFGNAAAGYGPGGGLKTGGAGYGGAGGAAVDVGGSAYGSSNAPIVAGSGGGSSGSQPYLRGGNGGGAIRLVVAGTAWLRNGATLTANGGDGPWDSTNSDRKAGGGSGGAIYLHCRRLISESGVSLLAAGGRGGRYQGGGGGGGRIAIWRQAEQLSGAMTLSVSGGIGRNANADYPAYDGAVGTIIWGWLPSDGTMILVR